MGWAKYTEDNRELVYERLYLRGINTGISRAGTCLPAPKCVSSQNQQATVHTETFVRSDRQLFCRRCGCVFLFSAEAQRYYEARSWSDPKRCKRCREYKNIFYLMRASS